MKFNERVGTGIGTVVVVIIAITVGVFVWTYERGFGTMTTDTSFHRTNASKITTDQAKRKDPSDISGAPLNPAANNAKNTNEDIETGVAVEGEDPSIGYLTSTLSEILFEPKKNVRYSADFSEYDRTHGYFWSMGEPDHKTEFFSRGGSLLSFPDGRYYCDDVKDFPESLTKKCSKGSFESLRAYDSSPLKVASGWKLVAGNADQDCGQPVYAGSVGVKAWYVWDYSYVERKWMLVLSTEDAKKMFTSGYHGPYNLVDAPAGLEKQLSLASEEKPISITIKKLSYYCEGAPNVSLTPPTTEGEI